MHSLNAYFYHLEYRPFKFMDPDPHKPHIDSVKKGTNNPTWCRIVWEFRAAQSRCHQGTYRWFPARYRRESGRFWMDILQLRPYVRNQIALFDISYSRNVAMQIKLLRSTCARPIAPPLVHEPIAEEIVSRKRNATTVENHSLHRCEGVRGWIVWWMLGVDVPIKGQSKRMILALRNKAFLQ